MNLVLGQCVDVVDERDGRRHPGVVREVVGVSVRVVWEEPGFRCSRWFGKNRQEKRIRGDSRQGYRPHHRVTERLQDPHPKDF